MDPWKPSKRGVWYCSFILNLISSQTFARNARNQKETDILAFSHFLMWFWNSLPILCVAWRTKSRNADDGRSILSGNRSTLRTRLANFTSPWKILLWLLRSSQKICLFHLFLCSAVEQFLFCITTIVVFFFLPTLSS